MIWTCGEDGRKETTKRSTTWTCERRQKQRKTKGQMEGQCKRRLGRERHSIIYSIWKIQEKRNLVKHNKCLIVSKLTEEKKEDLFIYQIFI